MFFFLLLLPRPLAARTLNLASVKLLKICAVGLPLFITPNNFKPRSHTQTNLDSEEKKIHTHTHTHTHTYIHTRNQPRTSRRSCFSDLQSCSLCALWAHALLHQTRFTYAKTLESFRLAGKHLKSYSDADEETRRYEQWAQNFDAVEHHNARYHRGETSFFLGMNIFADMSNEEYRSKMLESISTALARSSQTLGTFERPHLPQISPQIGAGSSKESFHRSRIKVSFDDKETIMLYADGWTDSFYHPFFFPSFLPSFIPVFILSR